MAAPQLGSYSSSTALSPDHYKLVQAVERAGSPEDINRVLLACLAKIKASWTKRAPSPTTARHDLVLVLYARSHRADASPSRLDESAQDLFDAAWALPVAVKLAGGAGLVNRDMGYRACAELFSPLEPHPLKLLLVNTIRSDLYVPVGADKAEARWAGSLRAAAHPALASPELAPAIRERVVELMLDPHYPNPIRRLALEALLSLARCTRDDDSSQPTSIVAEARNAVLSLVLPRPPSSSTSAAGGPSRRRTSSPQQALPPAFLAAIATALSPTSPLHPVLADVAQRIELVVQLCRRILAVSEQDERRTRHKGVKCVWATERALKVLRDELAHSAAAGEELGAREDEAVCALVWEVVEKMLETANEASDAVTLTALSLLPFLSTAIPSSPDSPALRRLLSRLNSHLIKRSSSVELLYALRALAYLPPSTWATVDTGKGKARADSSSAPADHSDEQAWGEQAWASILAGLDDPDSTIRRATLALVARVDVKLVEMQYERLLTSLSAPSSIIASTPSSSSVASGRATSGKRRSASSTIARVVEVLPFLGNASSSSPFATPSPLPPAPRLLALLARPELALTPTTVLPALIVPVLHLFQYAPLEAQRAFAHEVLLGEGGEWRKSVIAGLWAAGSVQVLEEKEAARALELLSEWLTQGDGLAGADLVALLQEPFIFAVLRLLALHPALDIPSALADEPERATAHAASPETARLFLLVRRCTSPADEYLLTTLRVVGPRTRSAQLGEFATALLDALDAHDGAASASSPPRPPSSSRLHHPPPAPSSAPLRYTYSPPHSPTSSLGAAATPGSASAALSLSSAALAREQADLLRERSERGGRGARKGEPVETVKTPRLRVGELPEESEGEDDRERGRGSRVDQVSGEREREEDAGETSGEPPADLLIQLDSLDPFRAA
ncbi:hypothetical protein JCM3775_002317 [Rhodotorula graminis]